MINLSSQGSKARIGVFKYFIRLMSFLSSGGILLSKLELFNQISCHKDLQPYIFFSKLILEIVLVISPPFSKKMILLN